MRYSTLCTLVLFATATSIDAQENRSRNDVLQAMRRAAEFDVSQVAVEGGYHDIYSADLKFGRSSKRAEGPTMVSVTGSGTPRVGVAYLAAWEATQDRFYLGAARQAGSACKGPALFWWLGLQHRIRSAETKVYLTKSIQRSNDRPKAPDYLARFYELKTNRPLFLTRGTRLYVGNETWAGWLRGHL